jgi:hypothetical protein
MPIARCPDRTTAEPEEEVEDEEEEEEEDEEKEEEGVGERGPSAAAQDPLLKDMDAEEESKTQRRKPTKTKAAAPVGVRTPALPQGRRPRHFPSSLQKPRQDEHANEEEEEEEATMATMADDADDADDDDFHANADDDDDVVVRFSAGRGKEELEVHRSRAGMVATAHRRPRSVGQSQSMPALPQSGRPPRPRRAGNQPSR